MFTRQYLYAAIGCVALVISVTTLVLRHEYRQQLAYWHERLTRIADVKQQVLEHWVTERDLDAQLLASLPWFRMAAVSNPAQPSRRPPVWHQPLHAELATVADTSAYAGAYVLDRAGRVQAQSTRSPALPLEVTKTVMERAEPKILTIPAPNLRAGFSQVAFIYPIRDVGTGTGTQKKAEVVGYVVLLTRAEAVSALLSLDAGATVTGETLLVTPQSGKPVFISPLRYWRQSQRAPLPSPQSLASMVLLQRGGVVGEYRDYRGIPVLAATRFLPQLGWGIVTKVDRAEALAGFQRTLIRDIGLALVLIIAIVSLAIAWARQQRLQRLQADLLNRKQTEAHLRQSADRFWAALQNSPVVVFNQDRELRYTWINQPVPPWSEVDYIGKTDEEIIGVTDGGRLSAFKRPVLATGIGVRQEWSFVCQGEKHDYDINVQPLRNNRGEIVGITCASTDITERKRVEEQLRESERKYRRLFETTEAFAQTDMTGKFREANPAYLRMLGYSAAELMELTYEDVTPERWRALDSNMIQNQILRRGYSDLFEKEYRKKDGTVFPVELRGFVVRDEANQPVGTWAVVRDITERKQAEQRLREYERVVEGLEEMIVVIDRNYRYQLANQAFLNYRGLKREQVIGRSVAEVLNKEIFENVLKVKLDECLQGKVVTFSMKYVYPKLGERDLYLSYFPIEGHNGFDRIACVLQDITDRKRAENALRESETRYRLLFERNPTAVYRCTLEGKLLDCNEAFARIAGCESREDALRFPVSQFYLPPETRASVLAELREQGSLGDFELCAKRKDGTPVWILANLTFLAGENGGPDLLEGAFVDITGRKNAEEALQRSETQLRAFIENAPYGIFRFANDRFLSANPALVRILGYNTEAEVTALNLAANVFSEASECRDLLELSRQRATFGPLQAQWKCRDGRSILVRFSGRLAPAPQNGHLIVEAIVEDITQQRSIEEHLRQADKMEALSRLATGIAHDFNNLLLGITLNLEHVIAGTGVTDTPLRQELEETLLAAKNAAVITRQLLAFGRKREMQPQSVNLNDVVTRSQDLLARLAGGNIYFNMRLDHKLGTAMADPVQIQQVILNLVVNARDALPGGGQITVKTANIKLENPPLDEYFTTPPSPGSYVVLEVTDNGSGISKEALSHVFEPFFTTKLEGSGLGLSTSHGIASQSSGYMSVRSQPGRGTTVKFYLPRGDEMSAARQTA